MRSKSCRLPLLVAIALAASLPSARAAITPDGDVSHSDPSTWDAYSTDVYIGNSANGGNVSSSLRSYPSNIYVGYGSESRGVVVVDGAGSTWNGYGRFHVGVSGDGAMSITNGANVTAAEVRVGANPGSTGRVDFGTNGGTLTTGALLASTSQLAGHGTIITSGLVSDIDLTFDASHVLEQVVPLQQPGQANSAFMQLA
jgi:T5SS/PEP-CTERM-associated repeat protein